MGDVVSDFHQIAVGTGHCRGRRHLYSQFAAAQLSLTHPGVRPKENSSRNPKGSQSPPEQVFIKIKLHATHFRKVIYRNSLRRNLINAHPPFLKGEQHEKAAMALATVATLGLTTVAAPAPAQARGFHGFGPAIAGGLIAGAVDRWPRVQRVRLRTGLWLLWLCPSLLRSSVLWRLLHDRLLVPCLPYRYRRVVRPAFAFYGGPRFLAHGWHHGWHRGWHHGWRHHW